MMKQKLIVIGNGMVGHHLLQQLVDQNGVEQYDITVFGAEKHAAYDRVHLSEVFDGKEPEALLMASPDWYGESGLELRLNEAVTAIDRDAKTLTTAAGAVLSYDRLVLATGSTPFVPPIPGRERDKCFVYRTLEDLADIKAACRNAKTGVVIGGGLLGLEAANALRLLGLETHVVEFAPRLMPVQLDAQGGTLLKDKIERLGLKVHTEKATQHIIDGESATHRLEFTDGGMLEADVLVFSAGIRPQDALGREAGLTLGERGGICINDLCQTSDPDIYAIGECALWEGKLFGLVAPGYQMARTVAAQLLGKDGAFKGADMSTKLKLLGVDVGAIGDAHGQTPGSQEVLLLDRSKDLYKKLVLNEAGDRLLGAVLVGDTGDYDTLLQTYLNDMPLPDHPLALLVPEDAAGGAPKAALPATATVCSCHNVSKGAIIEAVQGGACDVSAVKACTKAGTGCGGCAGLLTQVVNQALEDQGITADKSLCEHFAYSRQELFHLVKVGQIKSFDELLAKHGTGLGCDSCKPAAASIFASLWNEHVLAPKHQPLQDTNDTFLANMQKNGTYSVVPRVPGGEITPEQLIVLGQVAKRYDLYTKVTGGQRIDLFGARLEQLPQIWKELIDAGFETGHAYGKSLRTVKSCVGSTWCRYGVQDSLDLAVALEHRYKGLRSPHKLKFAVSGCTRECAEAQGKDVGVIATEKGWNLYFAGNGGMRPRHADLFATDLDTDTLIRYIDRLLMFYVATADKLQRTSVWMENLEGGLDYLREVIIDDSLGLAEELEGRMAHVIATYECEWKATLQDPEKLKRFKSFVNTDEADDSIVFERKRGQIRPVELIEIKEVS
ncbi:nitrite reductase (NAD(P)H) [Zobellella denitrificans]|uniref:Nitrite reductase n=1 Tax=Zobellella denitrificans TaxID=347534 RepID=A0A231N0Y2_9GAMM|nr:nitrite reductase large subunit NirB [Zobellella denitrificans]ATG72782.1 nitrite reductase [Zobellella denitrificans]OXS16088.1 nitrite reductase (NAD(P)H) [Zobellella denitrificans]